MSPNREEEKVTLCLGSLMSTCFALKWKHSENKHKRFADRFLVWSMGLLKPPDVFFRCHFCEVAVERFAWGNRSPILSMLSVKVIPDRDLRTEGMKNRGRILPGMVALPVILTSEAGAGCSLLEAAMIYTGLHCETQKSKLEGGVITPWQSHSQAKAVSFLTSVGKRFGELSSLGLRCYQFRLLAVNVQNA